MNKIELSGTGLSADPDIKRTAFASLSPRIRFDYTNKHRVYYPHLIKFVAQSGDVLRFRGVDLKEPHLEFGPDGTAQGSYAVDLNRFSHVYREEPSSLGNLGEQQCYAVMFLSEAFLQENDLSQRLLERARGGPKWPAGARAFEALLDAYKTLEADHDRLRQTVFNLLSDSTLNTEQQSKFKDLFTNLL
ncbi:hypothetical protein BE21_26085 [Sorangium cellulosum]|uniref:Uncharacterized protein n=1 Tax=Sorangium cellulosum TaxID=56 RepID=A0A150TU58_SORCE|nr:hypothetical protein BE21_26085 [Sorangium cellulosum]